MRQIEQILQHDLRIGAALMEGVHLRECAGGIAPQHGFEKVPDESAIGDAEHVAHRLRVDSALACGVAGKSDRLIEQRQPVAHRAVGGARDQAERRGRDRNAFGLGDPPIVRDKRLDRHAPQREALAARQHGQRHLADFGRRENEFNVRWRLFERFQQSVERMPGEHVNFVDDVDLVPRRDRAIAHAVQQLAHLVDPGMRGGIHLDHVDMPVLGDRAAMDAVTAGRNRRTAGAIRADAIKGAGDDPGGCGLPDPTHAGEHECLRDPPGGNRI